MFVPAILRILTVAAASSLSLSLDLSAQQSSSASDSQSPTVEQGMNTASAAPSPAPAVEQSANAAAVPVPSTANSPEIANPRLRPVAAQLLSRLDSKSAKTGDSVVVKTTEKATIANGIEIPEGSKIVGHITDVEATGASGDNSRLAIEFDQAELRGGQKFPIESVIQAVAPAGSSTSAVSASAQSASSAADAATVGTVAPAAGNATSPPVGTVIARNGNVAIRTTAIPGVLLAANLNGQPFSNASGALVGARRDLHLDGGTAMVLAVATAPSTANAR